PGGGITTYEWSEGGTVLATGASVTHSFPLGTHTVLLRVVDTGNAVATDTLVVRIDPNAVPTARAGSDVTKYDTDGGGTEAVALDGSTSSDNGGTISSFEWLKGAQLLATGSKPTIVFALGTHTVTLRVQDNGGAVATDDVVVRVLANLAPLAAAGADRVAYDLDGDGGENVALDGRASTDPAGTIVKYEWLEGGVVKATGATPTIRFARGDHTVTLKVTDNGGLTATDTLLVRVLLTQNPVAVIKCCCVDLACAFDGAASTDPDGTIAAYTWDFGDGKTATGSLVEHVFTSPGTYTVRLTVRDNVGATGTTTRVVNLSTTPRVAPTAPPAEPQVQDAPWGPFHDPDPTTDIESAWFDADANNLYVGAKVRDIPARTESTAYTAYAVAFWPTWPVADARWGQPSGTTVYGLHVVATFTPVRPGIESAPRFELQVYSSRGVTTRATVEGSMDPDTDIVWWVVPRSSLQAPPRGAILTSTTAWTREAQFPFTQPSTGRGDAMPYGADFEFPCGKASITDFPQSPNATEPDETPPQPVGNDTAHEDPAGEPATNASGNETAARGDDASQASIGPRLRTSRSHGEALADVRAAILARGGRRLSPRSCSSIRRRPSVHGRAGSLPC
ncbi:MAG TPA: PKD domain-containing protein, partial [Candidatus Thermoplasmatota archaeon]|nr:PKD domain-containing protein [Candidatus Thermoplasmatota archaeon]